MIRKGIIMKPAYSLRTVCILAMLIVLQTGCYNPDHPKPIENRSITQEAVPPMIPAPTQTPTAVDIPRLIFEHLSGMNLTNKVDAAKAINAWASRESFAKNGFWAYSVAADKSLPALPDIILLNYSVQQYASAGYAIYWWEDQILKYQVLPIDHISQNSFSDAMTVISARASSEVQGAVELGAVFDNMGYENGGEAKPWPVYKLLRLSKGQWTLQWSSPKVDQPDARWPNNRGTIQFTHNDISEFILEGDSLGYEDGKEKLLAQTKSGHLRFLQQTWIKDGEQYRLKNFRIAPATYNTLVEFIYALSLGNDKDAGKYVTQTSLLKKAKKLNLLQKSLDQEWWVVFPADIYEREDLKKQNPLTIVLDSKTGNGVKASFSEKDGEFMISDLVESKN